MTTKTAATKKLSVTDAQKIVDDLEAKASELAASRASDEQELAEISFQAHAASDQKAIARLETIKARVVKREVDARSIDAAIKAAQQKLAAAKDAEARAEEARVAEELLELSTMLREAGAKADRALKLFAEASNDLRKIIAATNQRGLGNPSAAQLQALGSRAILGSLIDSPYARDFQHLAPRERTRFCEFTSAWASALERFASQKLNKGGDEKVA